jgi:hypothetical protein
MALMEQRSSRDDPAAQRFRSDGSDITTSINTARIDPVSYSIPCAPVSNRNSSQAPGGIRRFPLSQ